MPPTMRAWIFTVRGPPSAVLKLRDDFPRPTPDLLEPDEILVKVSHVAIFQGFAAIMAILPHFNSNPWIPATDFSGVVEAVGSKVQNVKAGDAVFGSPDPKTLNNWGSRYNGMLAEYAILPSNQVVRKPDNISFEAACTLAGDGCTAVQFCEITNLKKGDRVLITAASGALGSLTAQVVRGIVGSEGTIVGTCSAANEELVKGVGADECLSSLAVALSGHSFELSKFYNAVQEQKVEMLMAHGKVIDYRSHPRLHEYLAEHYSSKPFNVIIDVAGADELLYDKSPAYLTPDGMFVAAGKMSVTHGGGGILSILYFLLSFNVRASWPVSLGGIPRRGIFHSGNVVQSSMQKLPALIEAGHIRGLVDSEWAMEDAIKAFERVATGRGRGKVIVRVQNV